MIKLIFLSHCFNSFSLTILMFIFFLFGYNSHATDLGLISSLTIVITQIFSSNKRNIVLSTDNYKLLTYTVIFRSISGLSIFFITYFIILNLNLVSPLNISFILLCILFWINEMFLTYYEIKKNKFLITVNFSFFTLFFIIIILMLYFGNFNEIYILLYCCLIFGIVSLFVISLKLNKTLSIFKYSKNVLNSFKLNIYDYSFLSSFSFLLSVFIWRYFIVKSFDKGDAIIYFISFAIASFPATLINNYLGVTLIKQKKNSFRNFTFYLFFYFTFSYLFIYAHKYIILAHESTIYFDLMFEILTISFLGTIIMIIGINSRLQILNHAKKNDYLFKSDFIYGIIIASIVPILHFSNYIEQMKYSYLISSVFTFVYFIIIKNNLKLNK